MKRLVRILLVVLLFSLLLSTVAGWMGAPGFLHPEKRLLAPDMVRDADVTFGQIGARREEFDARAPDGATLRGWKVRAAKPNGSWVLVFHGVADNRYGMTEHARLLLQHGYSVVMMDSRAHGASGGEMASYGWLERKDTSAVIDELERMEHPEHLFALGNSMGAGIVLQAAGADTRIEAVAAEVPFANLQEAAYDYAGLQRWPLLGKTLFAPGAWILNLRGEHLAGFPASEVTLPPGGPTCCQLCPTHGVANKRSSMTLGAGCNHRRNEKTAAKKQAGPAETALSGPTVSFRASQVTPSLKYAARDWCPWR